MTKIEAIKDHLKAKITNLKSTIHAYKEVVEALEEELRTVEKIEDDKGFDDKE